MALTFDTLNQWLQQLGVPSNVPIFEGPLILEMPAVAVHITLLPGTGYALEGAQDGPSFQIRARGEPNDQNGAETIAYAFDSVLRSPLPVTVNGTRFSVCDRVGGAPSALGPPDNGDRYEYTCTYRVQVTAS